MHEFPDGELQSSRLIFAGSCEPTASAAFDRMRRVREPVSRSKSGVQGKIADVFHGRSRHAESQNELRGFRVLLATARADHWQEQPFRLEYRHDGAKHHYTPDILVRWGTHQEVVEIKDDTEADLPEAREGFALIQKLLEEHGYYFRVWRKSEICAEPRLANVGLLLRYRCAVVSPIEREKMRQVFASTPEWCLRTFCEAQGIAVQSVLRMVLDGTLYINWWRPLTLDSDISSVSIGPKVWPFPPHGAQPQNCVRRPDAAIRN
jgi:hypothetical protein